jgi:hypothetical protein
MADTKTKARPNALYETDFYAWTQEQARLLRERRFDDLDLDNLVNEVESVGGSEKREIRNRLTILLGHVLKWKYQPGRRGNSWIETIFEQRGQLADISRSQSEPAGIFLKAGRRSVFGWQIIDRQGNGNCVRPFSGGAAIYRGTDTRPRVLSRGSDD